MPFYSVINGEVQQFVALTFQLTSKFLGLHTVPFITCTVWREDTEVELEIYTRLNGKFQMYIQVMAKIG